MKILKKILSALSMIIIILNYIPWYGIIYATENKYNTYVALGDSIAYGYGLENRTSDSYASKVKSNYNISDSNYKNLAVTGMKCSEFYNKIQENEYTEAIKKADLITVSIGSNELLEMAKKVVAKVTGVSADDENFVQDVQSYITKLNIIQKYNILGKMYDEFTSEETRAEIQEAVDSYEENWSKSVSYIKSINSDVTIVATEFYNPYYEVALGSYDLGGYVDEWIQKLNVILKNESNNESSYQIAKIYESFNTTNPRITNVSTSLNDFNVDPHPNILGHDLISKKIIAELTSNTKEVKDIASLTISSITDQTYTGSEIRPDIIIKDGDIILKENEDYTISYTNNINVGEARIIILGIGNYKGKVEKTFNIVNKSKSEISKMKISNVEDQTYIGIKITPDVEIYDGETKLNQNTDYELTYSDNINVGTAKITVKGIGNYEGSTTLNFKILAKNIKQATIKSIEKQEYTGEEIKANVNITDGSSKLVEGKDYNLKYENNVDVGQATIEITGIGNYTGTTTTNFNIVEKKDDNSNNIESMKITEIENKIYTGKLITPEVRITDGDDVLIKNTDYIINYTNNINVGTATATIKGIGNYTGEVSMDFDIIAKDINFTTIEDIEVQEYTGKEIKPELTITSDFIELKENTDYTVEYENNIKVGTASIKIKGIGNYTGEVIKTFNIESSENDDKYNDKNEINDNKIVETNKSENSKDKTTADSKLPYTGIKFFASLGIIFVVISIILYKKYKKMNF